MNTAVQGARGRAGALMGASGIGGAAARLRAGWILPAALAFAASLQIVGSIAAWPQDAALARMQSPEPNDPEFALPDGRQSRSDGAQADAAEELDRKCRIDSCDQAEKVEAREGQGHGAGRGVHANYEIPAPLDGERTAGTAPRPLPGADAHSSSARETFWQPGFEEPEHDPITEWKAALLEESGLLARQSEISESIVLMERQVKQAELIERLMEINGPDAAIEIAPGRFKVFRDTPAGRRIAAEMAENGLGWQKRTLELQAEIRRKRAELDEASASKRPVPEQIAAAEKPAPEEPVQFMPDPEPILEEILGTGNRLAAIFRIGETRLKAAAGDRLPGGALVVDITGRSASIKRNGMVKTHEIAR